MAKIDPIKVRQFTSRCFIADDGCLYLQAGEFGKPIKLAEPMNLDDPEYQDAVAAAADGIRKQIDNDIVLKIVREAANGSVE